MDGFQRASEHTLVDRPEYTVRLEILQHPTGAQMPFMHIDVRHPSPRVVRALDHDWALFRQCCDAAIFGFEPSPNNKTWEHFVSRFGFVPTTATLQGDDGPRRVFVSFKENTNGKSRPEPAAAGN